MNDEEFLTEKEREVVETYLLFSEAFDSLSKQYNHTISELAGIMLGVVAIKTRDDGWSEEEFHELLDEVKKVDWKKRPRLTVVK